MKEKAVGGYTAEDIANTLATWLKYDEVLREWMSLIKLALKSETLDFFQAKLFFDKKS